jgi:hypothetical protein
MDHSIDIRSMPIYIGVSRVWMKVYVTFYHFTIQVYHNHVLWCKVLISDSGWLDDYQACFLVSPRDVTTGPGNELISSQFCMQPTYFPA